MPNKKRKKETNPTNHQDKGLMFFQKGRNFCAQWRGRAYVKTQKEKSKCHLSGQNYLWRLLHWLLTPSFVRSTKNKKRKLKTIEHGTLQESNKPAAWIKWVSCSALWLLCCALARNNSLYVFNLDQKLVRRYVMKFIPRLSSLTGSYRKKKDLKSEP